MEECKQYTKEQIADYLQNRLSPEESQAFQLHLTECDSCRMELRYMRNLADFFTEEKATVFFPERTPSSVKLWRVAAVIGGLLLLASGSFYFFYSGNTPRYPVETDQAPIFHTGDTLKIEPDSLKTDSTLLPFDKDETNK